MATSGSFSTSARVSGSYNTSATFNWWQNGQSTDGNYTDIGWNLVGKTASSYQYIQVYGISVNINGQDMGASWSGKMYNGTVMASGTARIYHNSDGTKSFSASAGLSMYSSGSWYSGSGSWSLNTIPRASQPSINTWPSNSPDFNIGDTITIHMNRASSSFTHKVYFNYGSTSQLVAENVTTSCTFDTSTLSDTLYNLIPNATSYSNTIKVVTYSGSTYIGEKTCAYNAKAVESSVKPVFSSFSCYDSNSTTTAITGNASYLISGKSNLYVEINAKDGDTAQARAHATIANYLATFSGQSKTIEYSSSSDVSTTFSGVTASAGSQTVSVKAIDSRGYSATATRNMTVLAYSAPVVNVTATRANNFEDTTTVKVSGTYSPLTVNNVNKNQITSVTLQYKKTSTSTWTSAGEVGTITNNNGNFSVSDKILSLDNAYSWDVKITAYDKLGNTVASVVVSTGIPIFRIGTDGYVYNQEQPLMPSHVGQVIMSTTLDTAAKVKAIYGGTWEAWGAGRVPVGVNTSDSDFNAPNKTGGAKTVTLAVDQIPQHTHSINGGWGENSPGYDSYRYQQWGGNNNGYHDWGKLGTGSSGGGKAHQNMPPYATIYMWRRTA